MAVTHELKYKMSEFILNFLETLGLKRERKIFLTIRNSCNAFDSRDSCNAFSVMPF